MSTTHDIQQTQARVAKHQLFAALKGQIISLATALYGTRSTEPSTVFDVLSFTTPTTSTSSNTPTSSTYDANGFLETECEPTLSVALIQYTGLPPSPFTEWEMLSYVDDQTSMVAGAERLLEDLVKGVGGLVGQLVERGDWKVRHTAIPDLKAAGQEEGEGEECKEEEGSEEMEEVQEECIEGGGEGEQEGGRGW